MRKTARLRATKATFLTLTYPSRFPSSSEAKSALRALFERIRRRWPQASGIWRLEYQQRGAPHFHVIFFGLPFIPHKTIRSWWAEIISDYVDETLPFVRIEFVRSRRGIMHYVSKYVAKTTDEGLFNSLAYPHVGRWWGVFNKDHLPYAVRVFVVLSGVTWDGLDRAKDLMRWEWSGISRYRGKGACLFTDRPYILQAELQEVINERICNEYLPSHLSEQA